MSRGKGQAPLRVRDKQRNAFSENEAIIRPRSHHTMQRKPEDRVFPYKSQTCLVRLKQII